MFLKKSLESKLQTTIKSLINQDNNTNNKEEPQKKRRKKEEFKANPKINFNKEYKKFEDDDIKPEARLAKEYITNLKDPDILELQPIKRWNSSTKVIDKGVNELQRTLFEVRNGLRDVNIVRLKEKRIELGIDSRNIYYHGWNGSTQLINEEKKMIYLDSLEKAFKNTNKNWFQLTKLNKIFGSELSQPKIHPNRFVYLSPTKLIDERNSLIRHFKEVNKKQKADLKRRVEYENPSSTQEKISAIVFNKMKSELNSQLLSTCTKPWREHKGMFRNTLSTFHMTSKSGFNDKEKEKNQSLDFNKTSPSRMRLNNENNFYNTNGFNQKNMNFTGFSSFNNTNQKNVTCLVNPFQRNVGNGRTKSNQSHFKNLPSSFSSIPALKGYKIEYFPKEKWNFDEYSHTGKYVSLI